MSNRTYLVTYTIGRLPKQTTRIPLITTSASASKMWNLLDQAVKHKYGPKAKLTDWEMEDCYGQGTKRALLW